MSYPKVYKSEAHKLISNFYGDRTAHRSGVPLINHITEGCKIIEHYGGSDKVRDAFMLHPMLQMDTDLRENFKTLILNQNLTFTAIGYALEYRNIANATLSFRKIDSYKDIPLSPLEEVNLMLVADKVQNYKDFILYHKGTHERSDILDNYFKMWLQRLEIDDEEFQALCELISPKGI